VYVTSTLFAAFVETPLTSPLICCMPLPLTPPVLDHPTSVPEIVPEFDVVLRLAAAAIENPLEVVASLQLATVFEAALMGHPPVGVNETSPVDGVVQT